MKSLLTLGSLVLGVLFSTIVLGQGITVPSAASPAASITQSIGISTITVNYSRPAVKGRVIWGALVPYGWNKQGFGNNNSAPWRAGANENTTITFTHSARVEGKDVPAGSYGLFFVINNDNTAEVILSKDYRSWGSYWYNPEQDMLKATVPVKETEHTEFLTYGFIEPSKNSTVLVLNWEKKQFPVKIEFAVDDIVIKNAEEELKGSVGFTYQGYLTAAAYCLQNNTHLEQALTWSDEAIKQNRSFATLILKSDLLRHTGRAAEADKLMKEAMPLASENELNNYGYQFIGTGKLDKAIEILARNTEKHPKSANAWDSLGEAYALKGDKANAIKNFKRALSLNPSDNVRVNSEKYLKQLGAL